MKKMFLAILFAIINVYNRLGEDIADGIERKHAKQIAANTVLIIVYTVLLFLIVLLLLLLAVKFWWILLLGSIAASWIYSLVHNSKSEGDTEMDEVDMALIIAEGREYYEPMRGLAVCGIQGASSTTPLARPRDEFDIQTATTKDHFYLDGKTVVYQFEDDLEAPIDETQEDVILREVQRHITKNAPRFPQLMKEGRAPEVIDVKPLGGRVLIEVVENTKESRPMIEARRRARMKRQIRQERVEDPRYR